MNCWTAFPIETEIVEDKIEARTVVKKTTKMNILLLPWKMWEKIQRLTPFFRAFLKKSLPGENSKIGLDSLRFTDFDN